MFEAKTQIMTTDGVYVEIQKLSHCPNKVLALDRNFTAINCRFSVKHTVYSDRYTIMSFKNNDITKNLTIRNNAQIWFRTNHGDKHFLEIRKRDLMCYYDLSYAVYAGRQYVEFGETEKFYEIAPSSACYIVVNKVIIKLDGEQ